MKKLFFLPVLFACSLQAQTIKVLTYNIRLDNPNDGPDRWEVRRAALAAEVLRHHPSVAGFQEVTKVQIDFLDAELKGYQRYGVGREDGKDRGEFSPVYFDTTEFELVSGRTIWMSATPETPGKGWDAACERIATMVQLKHRVGKDTIWVVNTHWDHIGQTARLNSAALVLQNIKEALAQKKRVVFMGDLNATPETPPIAELSTKLVDACPSPLVNRGTFNGFQLEPATCPRIDYVWLSPGDWKVQQYEVLTPLINGRQVSDHYAVKVQLEFD